MELLPQIPVQNLTRPTPSQMVCEILPPSSGRQDVKWKTSPYFDQTVFEESLAADQILREESDEVFASRLEDSFVDIDIRPDKADNIQINAMPEAGNEQQHTKSGAVSTAWYAPEDPPQPSSYPGQKPPNCVARLGLCLKTIMDPARLKRLLQNVGKLWIITHRQISSTDDREIRKIRGACVSFDSAIRTVD